MFFGGIPEDVTERLIKLDSLLYTKQDMAVFSENWSRANQIKDLRTRLRRRLTSDPFTVGVPLRDWLSDFQKDLVIVQWDWGMLPSDKAALDLTPFINDPNVMAHAPVRASRLEPLDIGKYVTISVRELLEQARDAMAKLGHFYPTSWTPAFEALNDALQFPPHADLKGTLSSTLVSIDYWSRMALDNSNDQNDRALIRQVRSALNTIDDMVDAGKPVTLDTPTIRKRKSYGFITTKGAIKLAVTSFAVSALGRYFGWW
jgi:hypothetical protein